MIFITQVTMPRRVNAVRFYIGRPSLLGNPFRIGQDGTRAEVIAKYRVWLREKWQTDPAIKHSLMEIAMAACDGDVELACWCSPDPCHGDVIKEAVERLLKVTNFYD